MIRRLLMAVSLLATLVVLHQPSHAMIPCDQANAACDAMADADMLSCVIVYGEHITNEQFMSCTNHATRVYVGCMEAHGCPVIN